MAHRFIAMKRHGIGGLRVSGVSLALTLLMLLSAPAAHAKFTEPPAPVGGIQQGRNFDGHTWVRLVGPSCEGQGTQGWFLFPKTPGTPVQQLQNVYCAQ
jgi:hypothetical protein